MNISEISQTIRRLIETRINLVKLEVQDEVMKVASRVILLLVLAGLVLLVFLFFSLSLAFFLSTYFESTYLGFLVVGLLYLLIVLILYWSRYSQGMQRAVKNGMKMFVFDPPKPPTSDEERS